ncbi:hypothetical protein V2J09_010506, partial [Rumex salicifolius]
PPPPFSFSLPPLSWPAPVTYSSCSSSLPLIQSLVLYPFFLPKRNSMGRRTRSKKSDTNVVGKGKVTPVQVAFIVDCYLASNNFSATRSLFRSEASSLLPKCEAFKGLLSLEEMLDEYVCLKEQKVMLDQTMSHMNREKTRLQTLFGGKHNFLSAYNESAALNCTTSPLPPSSNCSPVPSVLSNTMDFSPAGFPALETRLNTPESIPDHSNTLDPSIVLTPVLNPHPPRKRKNCEAVSDISNSSKKACGLTYDNQSTHPGKITRQPQDHVASTQDMVKGASTSASVISDGSPLQGSTVAKNLFSSSSDISKCNPSLVQTRKSSISFHTEVYISPQEDMNSAKPNLTSTSVETTPANYTSISSKTAIANSPAKQNSIGRKNLSFSSPRKTDQVKGRLDFDTTNLPVIAKDACPDFCTTSDSDKDGDLFDLDFEPLSSDFSLSELLHDFGIGCEVVGHSCQEAICASTGPLTGSLIPPNEGDLVSQNLIEQDSGTKGSDTITSMRSMTKCINFSSPAKKNQGSTRS